LLFRAPAGDDQLMEVTASINSWYARGREADRLTGGRGPAEFQHNRDVGRWLVPPVTARVLHVGGAGLPARSPADERRQVRPVDPMPLHVRPADAVPGVDAVRGDARRLAVTLALGPLSHLPDRRERLMTLRRGGPGDDARVRRRRGHDQQLRRLVRHPGATSLRRAGRTPYHRH
jgi:hypothetical protein